MTYNITKSDGTPLVDIQDGTIDQTTDLKLIGKNSTVFGQALNEDLVYLLENFSNSTAPSKPLMGQLWYNTDLSNLQVYDGVTWRSTGSSVVKEVEPTSFVTGDLWMDSKNKQLYFFDGTALTLAGPSWTKSQGQTGFVPDTIYDVSGNARTILQLYVNNSLLGIYSAVDFAPNPAIPGFTSITKGYNSNSLIESNFDITVTNSLKLGGVLATNYVRTDVPSSMLGPLSLTSSSGIILGPLHNVNLNFSGSTFWIENTQENADISIRSKDRLGTTNDNIYIKSSYGYVGIANNNPQRTLDVIGGVRISGNLEIGSKILTKPIPLSISGTETVSAANAKILSILSDIANPSNYLDSQQALVHYEKIDFVAGSITRYLKRFVIAAGAWVFDTDLTSSV